MGQVDTANIKKNTKFNAAYTSKTFNDKMDGLVRRNGVLAGLQVSRFSSTKLKVTPGAFIQAGLIVEMSAEYLLDSPGFAFPWTVYGYSDDSQDTSPVTIGVVTTGSEPAGVVVLATSDDGLTFVMPTQISILSMREDIDALQVDKRSKINLLVNPGFELVNPLKGTAFIMQGPCVDGWTAENLTNRAPNSKVELVATAGETRGGETLKMTSESYADAGASLPDGSSYPAGVYSSARIWQSIDGYEDLVGRDLTLSVFLRLPPGQTDQLHDLEISIYGSSLGGPGFSDTPVDKLSYVIPSYTLAQEWQQFTIRGKIVNLNKGLVGYPLPAFPGISIRVAYVNSEPVGSPITTDKVEIDDCMLYLGDVTDPAFSPVQPAIDWLRAEELFEGHVLDELFEGGSSDLEYLMGASRQFRSKKQSTPSIGIDEVVVSEDGAALGVNSQASYDKIVAATSREEFRLRVSKLRAGYRPSRIKTVVRAQG